MTNKLIYKDIVILIMIFIGIFFYFLLGNINLHGLILYFVLILLFYFIEKIFSIDFKKNHYFYLIIISFSILFFYNIQSYFIQVDKLLHLIGGIMLTSITYYLSTKKNNLKKNRLIIAFLLSILVIFSYELYEYTSDKLFNTKMQGVYHFINNQSIMVMGKTSDTIQDILLGIIGVFIYLSRTLIINKM